jgi:hypothetical protein
MLELNSAAFYEATRMLQHTMTFIEERKLASRSQGRDGSVTIAPVTDQIALKLMRDRNADLREALNVLNAKITLMALAEYDATLANMPTWEAISKHAMDISRTLRRELTQAKVLSLNAQEANFYQPAQALFGPVFESRFPTMGAFELDEAAKCLALGRPTACVFHLIRLLEVGIKALALCLGIPDPVKPSQRNWTLILSNIMSNGIAEKWPDAASRMNPKCKMLEELHASLDAVKNPFRNPTMHIENKYTDSEAQHLFALVKGFMMKLSDRMDENGEPKA